MADQEPDGLSLGFSIQPDPETGKPGFIGLHFNTPFASYALAMPIEWAKAMRDNFTAQLGEVIADFERQNTGLVVAPASTLDTLKGSVK
jgi:hypothetical protein